MIPVTRILLLLFLSVSCYAQKVKTIALKAADNPLAVASYRIEKVYDSRADTGHLGIVQNGPLKEPVQVAVQHGVSNAVQQFIATSVEQPPAGDVLELHILELRVQEQGKGSRNHTDLISRYGFFKNGKKIIDYSGTSYLEGNADALPSLGKLMSRDLAHVMREFDTWWAGHREQYDTTGKNTIRVTVTLKTQPNDPDLIGYNAARPLTTDDFTGRPDPLSIALAATYSGFSVQYELQSDHTGATATIEVSPYFDKTKSWMKEKGKTAAVLRHEQVHFDIAAFKTFEFMVSLRQATFNVQGFKEAVENLQKQYSREMEQMQSQYDTETVHGTRNPQQQQWETRIKSELQQQQAAAGYR